MGRGQFSQANSIGLLFGSRTASNHSGLGFPAKRSREIIEAFALDWLDPELEKAYQELRVHEEHVGMDQIRPILQEMQLAYEQNYDNGFVNHPDVLAMLAANRAKSLEYAAANFSKIKVDALSFRRLLENANRKAMTQLFALPENKHLLLEADIPENSVQQKFYAQVIGSLKRSGNLDNEALAKVLASKTADLEGKSKTVEIAVDLFRNSFDTVWADLNREYAEDIITVEGEPKVMHLLDAKGKAFCKTQSDAYHSIRGFWSAADSPLSKDPEPCQMFEVGFAVEYIQCKICRNHTQEVNQQDVTETTDNWLPLDQQERDSVVEAGVGRFQAFVDDDAFMLKDFQLATIMAEDDMQEKLKSIFSQKVFDLSQKNLEAAWICLAGKTETKDFLGAGNKLPALCQADIQEGLSEYRFQLGPGHRSSLYAKQIFRDMLKMEDLRQQTHK